MGNLKPVQRGHNTNGLVPLKDACEEIGVHFQTGYRHRNTGQFPIEVLKIARRYYCRRTDLDTYLRAQRAS